MPVIDELIIVEKGESKNVDSADNKTIDAINIEDVNYHFAKNTESTGTCDNAVEEPIIDLKISGNSVQNGIPTPETPVEVESVGERTKNIFNLQGRVKTNLGAVSNTTIRLDKFTGNGYFVGIAPNNYYYEPNVYEYIIDYNKRNISLKGKPPYGIGFDFKAKSNTTYTFSIKEIGNKVALTEYSSNGAYIASNQGTQKVTYTTTENAGWLVAVVYTNEENTTCTFSDIQLEEGSTQTEYESNGYKVPVKVSGKNLFDKNKAVQGYIKADGMVENVSWYHCTDFIEVSGKYLIYQEMTNSSSTIRCIAFYDKDKNFVYSERQKSPEEGSISYVVSIPSNAKYFRCNIIESKFDVGMVYLGNETSEYEPYFEPITTNIYLNEPLRKIGDYADYIDYKNKKIIRKVGYYSPILNYVVSYTNMNGVTFRKDLKDIKNNIVDRTIPILSNMAEYSTRPNGYGDVGLINKVYDAGPEEYHIGIIPTITTLEEAQSYLNGFICYYILSTPTEETIDIPEILTQDGTNIFEIQTTIQPSATKINYWKQI